MIRKLSIDLISQYGDDAGAIAMNQHPILYFWHTMKPECVIHSSDSQTRVMQDLLIARNL